MSLKKGWEKTLCSNPLGTLTLRFKTALLIKQRRWCKGSRGAEVVTGWQPPAFTGRKKRRGRKAQEVVLGNRVG
jgi:hypothetical protein